MDGEPLDAGGDMTALRCPTCSAIDEAHDCVPTLAAEHPADLLRCQYELKYTRTKGYNGEEGMKEERWEVPPDQARLISSELRHRHPDGSKLHSPVLDIDFPVRLVPSATPGHFHLYLDGLAISTPVYEDLLRALAKAGVIEKGYAEAGIRREATFVWKPGRKPPEAARTKPADPVWVS